MAKKPLPCSRKQRHETYQKAFNHLYKLGKTFDVVGLKVYRCLECDGFHVGRTQLGYVTSLIRAIDKANGRQPSI